MYYASKNLLAMTLVAAMLIVCGCGKSIVRKRPEAKGKTVKLSSIKSLKHILDNSKSHQRDKKFYEINETVEIEGHDYVFYVMANHDMYRVKSIASLTKSLHEIAVVEDFRDSFHGPQLLHGALKSVGSVFRGAAGLLRYPHRAIGGIARYPGRTVRTYAGTTLGMVNPWQDPNAKVRTKDAKGWIGLPYIGYSGEVRRTAWELGVDVYTRNKNLSKMLRAIGKHRRVGRIGLGLATPSLFPLRIIKMAFTPGGLKVNTERAILENGSNELRRVNAALYRRDLGHHYRKWPQLAMLLFNVYYSPREHTFMRAYLTRINQHNGLPELFGYLGNTITVERAMINFHELEMHWSAHENHSKIKRYVPFMNHFGVVNENNELLVIIPWDVVNDNKETDALLEEMAYFKRDYPELKANLWFNAEVSDKVIAKAKALDINITANALMLDALKLNGNSMWPSRRTKKDISEQRKLMKQQLIAERKAREKELAELQNLDNSSDLDEHIKRHKDTKRKLRTIRKSIKIPDDKELARKTDGADSPR